MLPIKDLMTPSPRTITPDDTIKDAIALMQKNEFRHLPVVQARKLLGIVSLHELEIAAPCHLQDVMTVGKAIRGEAYTVLGSVSASEVATTMADQQLESVVIVDEGGVPVGIVTTVDLLRSFAETAE